MGAADAFKEQEQLEVAQARRSHGDTGMEDTPGFKSQLHSFLAVRPRASSLTSLSLGWVICQTRTAVGTT